MRRSGRRCPRPVPAAELRAPRAGRGEEQKGARASALARAVGLPAERVGEGVARLGRPLSAAGLDARAMPIAFSRTCRCSRRAAFWCGCPTGGRSARGRAWALPSAEAGRTQFDAGGMLDFKVQLALGDQDLDRGRMAQLAGRRRRAGAAARAMGRSRSRESCKRPSTIGSRCSGRSEDGLSFVEGMRLLGRRPGRFERRRASRRRKSASGRSFTRASGSAKCWPRCEGRRTCGGGHRRRLEGRLCASTRRRASTGCGSSRASGLGPAWPTTWGWARRSKSWPCCWL